MATIALWGLVSAAAAAAEPRIFNYLLAPEGLEPLHQSRPDGPPVMPLPQFRLFNAGGEALWTWSEMPRKFRQELEARVESGDIVAEARSLRQEARFFLRRGGLPVNLTTLPKSDLTVVEYWSDRCGRCKDLTREVDKFFRKRPDLTVTIVRVFIDIGEVPPLG